MNCWTACVDNVCSTAGCGSCWSPILLDLDSNGFHLVGLDDAVSFDIDADGSLDTITWTSGSQGDAFLALDRNGNGTIDSGAELFGNYTPFGNGRRAPNGYEALREFDLPPMGGNGNGLIDPYDEIWFALRTWIDANHNGVSEADELQTLDAAGVRSLDLRYMRSNHQDPYNNKFRFRARLTLTNPAGRERESMAYDVFFDRK
jgi:hypothetical protein